MRGRGTQRADLRHADVPPDELAQERPVEGVDGVLGRRVDRASRVGLLACDRAEVDDAVYGRGQPSVRCGRAKEGRAKGPHWPLLRALNSRTRSCVRVMRPRTFVLNMTAASGVLCQRGRGRTPRIGWDALSTSSSLISPTTSLPNTRPACSDAHASQVSPPGQ